MSVVDRHRFTVAMANTFGATVVSIGGELDGATSDDLRRALDELLDSSEPPRSLVLDLRRMTFIDTTGLNVLVHALRRMRDLGGELTLSAPTHSTRRLLAITGLDRVFTVTRA